MQKQKRIISDAARERMGLANRGKKRSIETRKKMSESHKKRFREHPEAREQRRIRQTEIWKERKERGEEINWRNAYGSRVQRTAGGGEA